MEKKIDVFFEQDKAIAISVISILQKGNECLATNYTLDSYLNGDNNFVKFIIAKIDEKYAGYIIFKNVDETIDLENILVDEKYRNMLVGSKMIEKMLEYAVQNNVKNIMLEVRRSNKKAICFYEKNGFQMVNIRKNYYNDTHEDALIYNLQVK